MLTTYEDTTGVLGSNCCEGLQPNEYDEDVPSGLLVISKVSFQVHDRDIPTRRPADRHSVRDTYAYVNTLSNDPLFKITHGHPAVFDSTSGFVEVDSSLIAGNSPMATSAANRAGLSWEQQQQRSENSTMRVTLRCHHGTMTMDRVGESLVFIHGAGFADDHFVFEGPLLAVNNALRGLLYTPDINWNSEKHAMDAAR